MSLRQVNARANEAAARLGHQWVGIEHFVLALLHPDSTTPASASLRSCGITDDVLFYELASLPAEYADRAEIPLSIGGGRFVSPEGMRFLGRAEGMAAGLGSPTTQPEHLLLALLWENIGFQIEDVLDRLGASRSRMLGELVRRGVSVPSVPLPPRLRWTEPTPVSPAEYEEAREALDRAGVLYRVGYKGDQILLSVPEGSRENDSFGTAGC